MPKPSPGDPSCFIDASDDVDQLLLAYPALVVNYPPEDTEQLQLQVQVLKEQRFSFWGRPQGLRRQQQTFEGDVVNSLAHGESVALGNAGCPAECP